MTTCIPCQKNYLNPTLTSTLSGKDCGIDTNTDGNCSLNPDGSPIVTPTTIGNGCNTGNGALDYINKNASCSPFDLSQESDTNLITGYIDEQLNIAGAPLNVYKMLGVYEQGKLIDLAGNGNTIDGGYLSGHPSTNAFDMFATEWQSAQTGTNVIAKSYIGYDFGPVKLNNGRDRYGIETAVKHDITLIKIKQSCNSNNRVKNIRLERSNDGVKWYGVGIAFTGDCDGLVTLSFPKTVPSRFWRIRPLDFNGGINDFWAISALELMDYEKTEVTNIQDRILGENRDRQYLQQPLNMKCYYQPIDITANASKFGFLQTADIYNISVSFGQAVNLLGRPFVVGDIIELPSEQQFTTTLTPIKKYLEITDVAWSTTSYTASWIPTMQRLLATPALASQETQDIFGKLTEDVDSMGLVDNNDGRNVKYQDISNISKTAKAKANTQVSERGQDNADITQISDTAIDYAANYPKLNLNKLNFNKNPYTDDAMPPNGESFTEGDTLPENPVNGAYHRLTYSNINGKYGKEIAPRLYRYSGRKKYWIQLAVDKRFSLRKTKPLLQEYIDPTISSVTDPKKEENDIL